MRDDERAGVLTIKIGREAAVRQHLVPLFERRSVAGLGEVQLLERFVERHDEPAFAALVATHGPMVLGVCRRLLADPLDVEDAFQATFLVLVRRAGSLKGRDRLGPWLFGVARKVASRARLDRARRLAREGPGVEVVAARPDVDDPARELGRALVEEIDRLPGVLRDSVLLCCVEGLTYDEAAKRLQSTASAIRGRLARARDRLRDRLTRRGFAPTAGALGVLLSTEVAPAAVSSRLLATACQVAMSGTVPVGIQALAEGLRSAMILTKSKIFAVALVACGVTGSGMGLNAQDPTPEKPPAADRLDQMEKKLDRVLRVLETPPATQAELRTIEAPNALDELPPASLATPAPRPPQAPPRLFREAIWSEWSITTSTQPQAAASPESRLDTLEQKLQSLEARLIRLEQWRGIGPGATGEPAMPHPAMGPTRSSSEVRPAATSPPVEG